MHRNVAQGDSLDYFTFTVLQSKTEINAKILQKVYLRFGGYSIENFEVYLLLYTRQYIPTWFYGLNIETFALFTNSEAILRVNQDGKILVIFVKAESVLGVCQLLPRKLSVTKFISTNVLVFLIMWESPFLWIKLLW